MDDANEVRSEASLSGEPPKAGDPEDMDRRREELIVFREAGVLTQAELEEQMVRLRWGLP
jgi:hypothetical protein